MDIENLRAITYEALQERYKVGQQHRLQMWSEQLEAVRTELKTRGLGDIPTAKLIELLDTLSEKLKSEAYSVRFKSEPVVKPYEMFDIEKYVLPPNRILGTASTKTRPKLYQPSTLTIRPNTLEDTRKVGYLWGENSYNRGMATEADKTKTKKTRKKRKDSQAIRTKQACGRKSR